MPSTDIYAEHSGLGRPIAWSAGLHLAFAVVVTIYAAFFSGFRGSGWGAGGGGEAMGATLVTSVPLPAPTSETSNVLATESKGLSQSQPKVEEKEPEAIPIPDEMGCASTYGVVLRRDKHRTPLLKSLIAILAAAQKK